MEILDKIDKYLSEGDIPTVEYKKVGADDWIVYDENTGEIQKIVKAGKRKVNISKHFVSSKSAGVKASYAVKNLSWLFLKNNKGFSDIIKTIKNNESRNLYEDSIKIDGKEVKAGRVINNISKGMGKIVGTVFGSKSEVQKGIKRYEGKGYNFLYFVDAGTHTIRVVDKD